MKNTRIIFIIIWSFLSIIGIFLWNGVFFEEIKYLLYFITGFHTPKNAVYFFVYFGAFSEHPEISIVFAIVFVVFMLLWIVALFKFKNSKIFNYLILGDRAFALVSFLIMAVTINGFIAWWQLIGHIAENVIILLLAVGRQRRQATVFMSP